jgi:hypothetical protein
VPAVTADLVAFLRAQLDATAAGADRIHDHDCYSLADRYVVPDPCDCGVPARVLADVKAKRRLVAMHVPRGVEGGPPYRWTCRFCDDAPVPWEAYGTWPCETLRLLALPFADREGYDETWRP